MLLERLSELILSAVRLLPAVIVMVVSGAALWGADRVLLRRPENLSDDARVARQLVLLVATGAAMVAVILVLPVQESTRGSLLSLIGLVVSAMIALSSTTFVANAMAGLMLRSVGDFRPGDFIHVGDSFGRVTERGLFHTEIQSEDRDLVTLPNLYIVSNPLRVVRASGTIVSATVSLGYDTDRRDIEKALLAAADEASLEDPFVLLLELGDFSVTYRVAGFLAEPKHLLSSRSRLRAAMLDCLHGAGIEIVSPTWMNQRRVDPGAVVRPDRRRPAGREGGRPAEQTPEDRIFDKAERAGRRAELRAEREALTTTIAGLEKEIADAETAARTRLERRLEHDRVRLEALDVELARQEAKEAEEGGEATAPAES